MSMNEQLLGEILLLDGKVAGEELGQALASQARLDKPLGDILTEMGYVSQEDVAAALARQLDIPFFPPDDDFRLEREEVALVPEAIARKFCLIPIKRNADHRITLIMRDPIDVEALDTVRSLTNLEVHKAIAPGDWILKVINKFYSDEAYLERSMQDLVTQENEQTDGVVSMELDAEQLRVMANDAPVVQVVNLLLMEAMRDRASDIHIEPQEKELRIRLRVDGKLRELQSPPRSMHQAIVTRIKILANMDIAERRLPLDGRFKFKVHERVIDIRVSSFPEVHGEKVVMRVLDRNALLLSMSDIGIEDDLLRNFQRILKMPHGIILLTGPTGSGKTSTLYSALNFLRSPTTNIQTVEDPVEYLIDGINQMQTRPLIGLDFAQALRSILRQDPDIIMIGEIRDLETARIAIQASLTGHLVLSTLHTNDAPSTFSRLQDIGLPPYLIAATMNLAIAQRLVRKICERCKRPVEPEPEELLVVKRYCPDAGDWTFYRGAGCPECRQTGFRGRTAILEFLEVTDALRDLILRGAGAHDLRKQALSDGMEPLIINGLRKVRAGTSTVDEVLAVCATQAGIEMAGG